jgi:glycosyltransferase involved in cell wall biosynthesis
VSAERILIVCHAHPDLSLGGGELAAYSQWQSLRRRGIEAMFLGRAPMPSGHAGTPFTARSADGRDLLFHAPPVDHFRHSQPQRRIVYENFRDLLRAFQPTAVHFHHYVHLGLELVREARRYSATMPIVMTLHDYLGMCHAQGQMRKTSGLLCQRASPLECHGCFPERSPQEFFLRELFVKSFFALVDRFVCPSAFLRDRYAAWGLPPEKLVVLDNGLPAVARVEESGIAANAGPGEGGPHARFAVIGQLSELKGTLVALEAARLLPRRLRASVRIEVHGTMQHAPEEFRRQVLAAQEALAPMVSYRGPYRPESVDGIVRAVDWLVVPSIWWENSPLVIQEAFRAGRPVICSNIGGMAEKVRHGVDGLHFNAGSPADLARCLEEAATTLGLWERLSAGVTAPAGVDETVDRLLEMYRVGGRDTRAIAAAPARGRARRAGGAAGAAQLEDSAA